MIGRSCGTCASWPGPHKIGSLDDCPPSCWTCSSDPSLPQWRPKVDLAAASQGTPKVTIHGPRTRPVITIAPVKSGSGGAWATQVGGDHYKKLPIQPFQYSMANGLDPMQHTTIKYITRFRDKGGVADLEKAKQTIDLLIAWENERENLKG